MYYLVKELVTSFILHKYDFFWEPFIPIFQSLMIYLIIL